MERYRIDVTSENPFTDGVVTSHAQGLAEELDSDGCNAGGVIVRDGNGKEIAGWRFPPDAEAAGESRLSGVLRTQAGVVRGLLDRFDGLADVQGDEAADLVWRALANLRDLQARYPRGGRMRVEVVEGDWNQLQGLVAEVKQKLDAERDEETGKVDAEAYEEITQGFEWEIRTAASDLIEHAHVLAGNGDAMKVHAEPAEAAADPN
jgi:hypothetical protein